MNIVSISVFVIAGVTFFISLIHLINYFFTKEKEYILFFLTSFTIVIYDFFCVQLYNSTSLSQGVFWQWVQTLSLAVMSIPLVWFVTVYTKQKNTKFAVALTIAFIFNILTSILFKDSLTYNLDFSRIKNIILFNGLVDVTYYEVYPGPLIQIQLIVSLIGLIYSYYVFIKYFIQTKNKEVLLIIAGFVVFTLGIISDTLVARGFYKFIYTIEFCYFFMALTMALTLIIRQAKFQKKLNESEEKYYQITSSIPGAVFQYIVRKNKSINLIYVSDSLMSLFNVFSDVDRISEEIFLNAVHRADVARLIKAIENSAVKVESYAEEFRILEKNGEVKWIKGIAKPLRLNNDEVLWNGVLLDITARKNIEKERESLIKQLDLRNKELQDIIYVMSHDLKTPLVNIIGFSNELEYIVEEIESIEKEKDENKKREKISQIITKNDARESLKFIKNAAYRMDTIINGLLKFSRFGRTIFKNSKIDMNAIVEDVIDTMQFIIKEKKVKINIGKLPSCYSDEKLINQVFANLLDNAIKYLGTSKRGIISISGFKKNNFSVYCVEDNGIGINSSYVGKIFDIFYKIDTDASTIGEGLGLSIVKSLLNYNNGKIWVESTHGQGSKFFFQLPNTQK